MHTVAHHRGLKTVEEVARESGQIDLSRFREDGDGRLRGSCPFRKHRSQRTRLPFVIFSSSEDDPGGWKCHAGCGEGGVKELAEQLKVQPFREGREGAIEPAPSAVRDSGPEDKPKLTAGQAKQVVQLSFEYLRHVLRTREEGNALGEEVYQFCNRRMVQGLLEPDNWAHGVPMAGILPASLQDEELQRVLGTIDQAGYRLVFPLYSKNSGVIVSIHVRNVLEGVCQNVLSFGSQQDGVLLANDEGQRLLVGVREGEQPPRVIIAEGATDFLALSLHVGGAVLGLAGAQTAKKAGSSGDDETPARWLSGVDLVIATDSDEAGERAARTIAEVAHRRGGARTVRRVQWPGKDACELLESGGPKAIAEAVENAPLVEHPRYRFRVMPSFAEFMRVDHPKPESLVGNGLVRERDFVLLSGKAYSGKSWLMLDLALAAGAARPWLGFSTRKCRVGVFSREIEAGDLQDRFRTLLSRNGQGRLEDLEVFAAVHPYVRGHVDLVEDLGGLKDFCWANRIDLLILDPLSRLHTTDENSSHEFKPVMMAVDEIREDCRTAVLLVHHDRKSGAGGSDGDLDAPRGSSLLTTNPTVSMRLVELEKFRRLSFHLNHAKPPDPVYLMPHDEGGFIPTDAPMKGKEKTEKGEMVLRDALREKGSLSYAEACELTDLTENPVRSILEKLKEEGLARKCKDGKKVRFHLLTENREDLRAEELQPSNDSRR